MHWFDCGSGSIRSRVGGEAGRGGGSGQISWIGGRRGVCAGFGGSRSGGGKEKETGRDKGIKGIGMALIGD